MNFLTVLTTVAVILLFMFCGLFTVKIGKAKTEHAQSVSGLLMYICAPAMLISSFLNIEHTKDAIISVGIFFLVSLTLQFLFFLILFLFLRKKFENAKYRIFTVASFMGNVGFFGLPLVTALFPDNPIVACYSCANMLSMNILVYTLGTYLITGDKKFVSVKTMLLNPTSIALYIALPLYFFSVPIHPKLLEAITLLGKMTTPLCMFVLGMRLALISFKQLVSEPPAYLAAAAKLVVYPLFCFLVIKFLPFFDETFKTTIFALSATPSAAFVLTLAELHEKEQALSANVVLLSCIFSIVTIPLLLLLA